MARYIERAEDITRLLAVNFNTLLEAKPADARRGWESALGVNGEDPLFTELHSEANAQAVIRFMFWEPLNSNSVVSCITRARENARAVREQISSEMWEAINRLYFLTRGNDRPDMHINPTEFFESVRDRAQTFQGITSATMTHGEPYRFIQLGLFLERADKTARILDAKYHYINQFSMSSSEISLQLIALLRSCAAFEPYRRASAVQLDIVNVTEYLLLNNEFPRAVLFCLNVCLRTLSVIGEDATIPIKSDSPRRVLGRLVADLEYLDIHEILGENMDPFLTDSLTRLNSIGEEIARTYFNTSIILPDERPRQQQQQQQ